MFIVHTVEVLAFNKAGDAVLIEASSAGPEGGGSRRYSVLGPSDAVSADVSSDFSPGDGSTPEAISAADCRKVTKALQDAVLARGFEGVTVRPERCAGGRVGIVEVAAASRAKPRAIDDLGDITVKDKPGGIQIRTAAGELSLGGSEHGHVTVWRQAAGPLLVVQFTTLSADGAATEFVNVSAAPVEARFPFAGPLPGL